MLVSDVLILGGGVGSRFGSAHDGAQAPVPKQFIELAGKPVFIHALEAFLSLGVFRQYVLVFPAAHLKTAEALVEKHVPVEKRGAVQLVVGGETRFQSTLKGLSALEHLDPLPTRVAIHDACRPFLSDTFLARVRKAIEDRSFGAWVPGVPVVETLKKVKQNVVVKTESRENLFRAQTPQIFEYSVIRSLIAKAETLDPSQFTDDVSVCEYFDVPVGLIPGDEQNIKLTYPFHLEMLRTFFAARKEADKQKGQSCQYDSELDTIYTD